MNGFTDNNTPLRMALCARVSDEDKQGDNYSAPDQLDRMRAWCLALGWTVAPEHEFIEKDSAFIDGLDRPELNKMLHLARDKKIDGLMFYRSDRFTRDAADGVVLRRKIKNYGARLFFYSPSPHEVSSDMELINILEDYVSQRDAEKRREDSMRGYEAKVKDGVFSQGTAPYGYRLIGRKREARLVIVPKLKKIIGLIFEWYVYEGIGTIAIAQRLTDMGIPTPGEAINRNRHRPDGIWYQSTVYDILRDETYAGIWHAYRYKRVGKRSVKRPKEEWVPVPVPAIISRDLWEKAQQRMNNRGDHKRNVKHEYLMGRRLTCSCGYAAQGRCRKVRKPDAPPTLYYVCSSKVSKLVRGTCSGPFFRADDVDAEVWAQTKELLTNPGDVLRAYQKAQQLQNTEQAAIREQISIIDEQIAEHNATIDNLLDARKSVTKETLKRKLDADADRTAGLIGDLAKRRTTLEQKLQETTITDEHIAGVTEKLKDAQSLVAKAKDNPQAQRKLIEFLNLHAELRVDEAKDRWVNIQFLFEVYPRRVGKQGSGSVLR